MSLDLPGEDIPEELSFGDPVLPLVDALFYFDEELLCMRSAVGLVSGLDMFFDLFPVLAMEPKSFNEESMLLLAPSPVVVIRCLSVRALEDEALRQIGLDKLALGETRWDTICI